MSEGNNNKTAQSSKILLDDEDVLIDTRPAWSAYAGQLLIAIFILLFGLITSGNRVTGNAPLAFSLILVLIIVASVFYQRRKIRYLVTDRRIMVKTGISSSATNEAWMEDVRGLQTGASFIERFLGHGHVAISTSIIPRGSSIPIIGVFLNALPGGDKMTLGGINDYERIAQMIRKRQSERKGNN